VVVAASLCTSTSNASASLPRHWLKISCGVRSVLARPMFASVRSRTSLNLADVPKAASRPLARPSCQTLGRCRHGPSGNRGVPTHFDRQCISVTSIEGAPSSISLRRRVRARKGNFQPVRPRTSLNIARRVLDRATPPTLRPGSNISQLLALRAAVLRRAVSNGS
jgi:hypothetical protein